jgi:formate C-acetyltransferase
VFRAYTNEMRAARKSHVITGLPDAYGRGRIIGDYRRVALYGVDRLIGAKKYDKENTVNDPQLAEEVAKQIKFLTYMKEMALQYGFDISQPALNFKEAV